MKPEERGAELASLCLTLISPGGVYEGLVVAAYYLSTIGRTKRYFDRAGPHRRPKHSALHLKRGSVTHRVKTQGR